jgi:hypothetical protein
MMKEMQGYQHLRLVVGGSSDGGSSSTSDLADTTSITAAQDHCGSTAVAATEARGGAGGTSSSSPKETDGDDGQKNGCPRFENGEDDAATLLPSAGIGAVGGMADDCGENGSGDSCDGGSHYYLTVAQTMSMLLHGTLQDIPHTMATVDYIMQGCMPITTRPSLVQSDDAAVTDPAGSCARASTLHMRNKATRQQVQQLSPHLPATSSTAQPTTGDELSRSLNVGEDPSFSSSTSYCTGLPPSSPQEAVLEDRKERTPDTAGVDREGNDSSITLATYKMPRDEEHDDEHGSCATGSTPAASASATAAALLLGAAWTILSAHSP